MLLLSAVATGQNHAMIFLSMRVWGAPAVVRHLLFIIWNSVSQIPANNQGSFWTADVQQLWILGIKKFVTIHSTPDSSDSLKSIALHGKPISELRGVACYMKSHGVSVHPFDTGECALLQTQPDSSVLDLTTTEGLKAELILELVKYCQSSNQLIVTRLRVEPTTSWS